MNFTRSLTLCLPLSLAAAGCAGDDSALFNGGALDDDTIPVTHLGPEDASAFLVDAPSGPDACVALASADVIARAYVGDYAEARVVVQNRCTDRPLFIEAVTLLDIDGAFSPTGGAPSWVPAGGEVAITVGFTALDNIIHVAELEIISSDVGAPRVVAELYGLVPRDDEGWRSGAAPTADSGANQSVVTGSTVNLDGSASSDPESDPLTYRWVLNRIPGGSAHTAHSITDRFDVTASFLADVSGDFRTKLVVSDSTSIDKDFTWFYARGSVNTPPVAYAGVSFEVEVGATANLDGTGSSDADGDPLTYTWTFHSLPGGSGLSNGDISGASTASASFIPDVAGDFRLKLRVNDGIDFDKDWVYVTATEPAGANNPPTSDAGPDQSVETGAAVNLDGSGSSDPDSDPITYAWTFSSTPGGSALGDGDITGAATATPSFTPDVDGTYTLQLVVDDGELSGSDSVDIVASTTPPPNTAPTADAGADQSVDTSALVNLSGDGSSDPESDPLTYTWSFSSAPGGSSLTNTDISNRTSSNASFTPDVAGTFTLQLVVDDGEFNDSDLMDVVASDPPPTYTFDDDIWPLLQANCDGCHLSGGGSGGFNMDSGYTDLVNVSSVDVPSMDYIEPSDSANSYLLHKLNNTQGTVGGAGSQMPLGGPLDAGDITMVETWIDEGAPEN